MFSPDFMHSIGIHALFFFVGIGQDLLITYYYQMIVKEYPWRSAMFSTVVTLVNILVLYQILSGLEEQILSVIFVYALGNGVGTYFIINKHVVKKILFGVK